MWVLLCRFFISVSKESPYRDIVCAPTCCEDTLDLQELERGEREILHCIPFCDTPWILHQIIDQSKLSKKLKLLKTASSGPDLTQLYKTLNFRSDSPGPLRFLPNRSPAMIIKTAGN